MNLSESSDYFFRLFAGKSFDGMPKFPTDYDNQFQTTSQSFSSSFCPSQVSGIMNMDTPEGRALATSKNHKEAERRRRERINSHLDRLRNLLPCNYKTDKASLLAKVVQRVKELKEQTSEIMQDEIFPSETDEISIFTSDNCSNDGRLLIKACLCCEDRSDLIPELIETLKSLSLTPLRAEMVSMGGKIRNVITLASDKDHGDELVQLLKDALLSFVQRSIPKSKERAKRRRVFYQRMIT